MQTVQLKQIDPLLKYLICSYTLLAHYVTIDVYTSNASPYNLTISNSLFFSFFGYLRVNINLFLIFDLRKNRINKFVIIFLNNC